MMLGCLPKSLEVSGREIAVRSDFRPCLAIMAAFSDEALTQHEKACVMVDILYRRRPDNLPAALERAVWFLNCGNEAAVPAKPYKLMDWQQDEMYIFSAVNKKAGFSVRSLDYLHWWDFIGYYMEPDDGVFSQIVSIRSKLQKGEKLEKHESRFYQENRSAIDLKNSETEALWDMLRQE